MHNIIPHLTLAAATTALIGIGMSAASTQPSDASPREKTAAIAVTNATTTALIPTAYTAPTSGRCVVPDTTAVYVVEEAATGTGSGDGPYCTDATTCPAGPVLPIAGKAWARSSAGSTTLRCRFVDAGGGFTQGGNGPAPLTLATALATFVQKAGDAMTGALALPTSTAASPALTVSGDLDTGMGRTSANEWTVSTGGIGRQTWTDTLTTTTTNAEFAGTTTPGATPPFIRLPRYVAAGAEGALPCTTSAHYGRMLYADDTSDGAAAAVCVCRCKNAGCTSIAWEPILGPVGSCPP